eukprot:2426084-Pyramimonas_sp.AAC.1
MFNQPAEQGCTIKGARAMAFVERNATEYLRSQGHHNAPPSLPNCRLEHKAKTPQGRKRAVEGRAPLRARRVPSRARAGGAYLGNKDAPGRHALPAHPR